MLGKDLKMFAFTQSKQREMFNQMVTKQFEDLNSDGYDFRDT